MSTTATCLKLYTGVGLDGRYSGRQGSAYERYAGLCLECEAHPNGAKDSAMGDIPLYPGQLKSDVTQYAFRTI